MGCGRVASRTYKASAESSRGTKAGGFRFTTLVKQPGSLITVGQTGSAYARNPRGRVSACGSGVNFGGA
jgi:hypothetical protein